jgi:hypothetical protein
MSDDRSGGDIDIERAKLDLDRYKAQLDFRKFIFGSVFAAVAIAAIPPLISIRNCVS